MRFFRIMDDYKKVVNALVNKEIVSARVRIQGYEGFVEITRDNLVKSVNINGAEMEIEKSAFLVNGKTTIEDIEGDEVQNAYVSVDRLTEDKAKELKGKDATRWSRNNNTWCDCTYGGVKAKYYGKEHKLELIFNGLLYVA